jgi:hypothetical protein
MHSAGTGGQAEEAAQLIAHADQVFEDFIGMRKPINVSGCSTSVLPGPVPSTMRYVDVLGK